MSESQRRPRGRPQRLPHDDSHATSGRVDGNKRLAWLLATGRILSATGAPKRSEFVTRLKDAGVKADSSRISRWESGLEHLSPRLVRAYESATGSTPYAFLAARQLLVRAGHLEDRPSDLKLAGLRSEPDQFDQIMDRVHAQNMHGDLWLRFATAVGEFDHVYMHQRVWRQTTDLLVDELARSTGLGYLHRYEAAVKFLSYPTVRPHLTRSIGQFTLEPGAQMVTRVLAVLGEDPDGGARELLLRMISTSSPTLAASAGLIASRLVDQGFVAPDEKVLEVHAGRAIAATSGRLPAPIVDLACRVADEPFQRLVRAVTDPAEQQRLRQARETGEAVDADAARLLSEQIAHEAEIAVGRNSPDPDLMLRKLVREALFHVHRDRRDLAATLLMTSPYAAGVAAAALDVSTSENESVAASGWSLARHLGQALDPRPLAVRVLAETRPGMQLYKFGALAWSRDAMTDELAAHVAQVVHDRSTDPTAALSGVAALGMYRRQALFREVRDEQISRAMEWWRTTGGAIHEG